MAITIVFDATHENIGHLPAGQAAGYTTGSVNIAWTVADWKAHPKAVRIDQDFGAIDTTADILDVERGAATNAEAAGWFRKALSNYKAAVRPGQRHPGIYTSASNVTPLVNALIAGGVNSGPNLWIAKWDFSNTDDIIAINNASGPFPIIGGQFANGTFYDTSVFSTTWLNNVSGAFGPPYRHLTKWWQTPAGIAKARGTTVEHLFAVSAAAYTPEDFRVATTKRLRTGIPYYTTNP